MLYFKAFGEEINIEVMVDRYAYTAEKYGKAVINMISFSGTASEVNAVIAMMQAKKISSTFKKDSYSYALSTNGYEIAKTKLSRFNGWHVVAVEKNPEVVYGDRGKAVKRFLFSPHINTPILAEWVPEIIESLSEKQLITEVDSYGIEVHRCEFEIHHVDEIVTELLQAGTIKVPRKVGNAS